MSSTPTIIKCSAPVYDLAVHPSSKYAMICGEGGILCIINIFAEKITRTYSVEKAGGAISAVKVEKLNRFI
jgi:hypothetical protein